MGMGNQAAVQTRVFVKILFNQSCQLRLRFLWITFGSASVLQKHFRNYCIFCSSGCHYQSAWAYAVESDSSPQVLVV